MELLIALNPKEAKEFIDCYEGTFRYYNFLTESETESILEKLVNQDGSKGPKWRDPEDFYRKVTDMGGKLEFAPHYNRWALFTTANKMASDHHSAIAKWVGEDRGQIL